MRKLEITTLILVSICSIGLVIPIFVFASTTDGTIDSVYKYAWSENAGWINFGCNQCNVHITDSAITGYAWSDNYGWINLNPTTSGVKNDCSGNLSGYAWGENLGWIDFDNVSIDSNGEFHGIAFGTFSGRINFDCANCKVKTDWRPCSVRAACNNNLDDDSDGKIDYPNDPGCSSLDDTDETDLGGGMPSAWFHPPKAPEGGFRILINNGDKYTDSQIVVLNLFGGPEAVRMVISNFPDFRDAGQEPYNPTKVWNLCKGLESCPEEGKIYTVYAKFYAPWGLSSEVVSDSIIYTKEKPVIEKIKEVPEKIVEKIKKIPKKIIEIIKPRPEKEIVPKEAPLSMKGKWNLLTYTRFNLPFIKFTLAPLSREFQELAEKFPELGKTFKEIGVTKLIDIKKLRPIKLTLPGLTEKVGLPTLKIEPGKFALPKSVPVAKLSPEAKQKLPSEIVFAKTGGELIDFNINLSVSDKGEPQLRIRTISGKPLQLVIKPDKPVKSIKGYVVFKSKMPRPTSFQFPLNHLVASLIFANPVFAKPQEKPVQVEEKLVLQEFEYTDPDGDGIYTAEISAPVVEGEYEIITVFDFEDPELGKKGIRLITVVDPEGYIYTTLPAGQLRIAGAIVSIYWLNPETKQYELWPAKEYQQENPQITDDTGKYSFLVPPGTYYLRVEHPNYPVYQSETFVVKEGSGIHMNIELKAKFWWLKIIDWKIVIIILFGILLAYNFYRDRRREKLLEKIKNL